MSQGGDRLREAIAARSRKAEDRGHVNDRGFRVGPAGITDARIREEGRYDDVTTAEMWGVYPPAWNSGEWGS